VEFSLDLADNVLVNLRIQHQCLSTWCRMDTVPSSKQGNGESCLQALWWERCRPQGELQQWFSTSVGVINKNICL